MKRKDLPTHLQDKKDYHLEKAMDMVMQHNVVLAEVSATLRMMATGAAKCDTSHIPTHCFAGSRTCPLPIPAHRVLSS